MGEVRLIIRRGWREKITGIIGIFLEHPSSAAALDPGRLVPPPRTTYGTHANGRKDEGKSRNDRKKPKEEQECNETARIIR